MRSSRCSRRCLREDELAQKRWFRNWSIPRKRSASQRAESLARSTMRLHCATLVSRRSSCCPIEHTTRRCERAKHLWYFWSIDGPAQPHVVAEARKALGRLYSLAYSAIESADETAVDKFSWIPASIIDSARTSDPEIQCVRLLTREAN